MTTRSISHDSSRVVIATDPDFDPGNVVMEFRLTYAGPLLSTGNKSRPSHVHEIRRRLHPQLRRFWSVSPWLKDHVSGQHPYLSDKFQKIAGNFSRCGYSFVPLVRAEEELFCALEILYLHPGVSGKVLNSGDIDGRLATLFDALAVPRHCEQLKGYETPKDDETPFYCLLEDDALVTQVAVDSGEILEQVDGAIDENSARIVVTVRLSPQINLGYGKMA